MAGNSRILCPVVGCPESLASSIRYYHDFKSIRNHLDQHCSGQLSGAIPVSFLRNYGFTQYSECDKTLSTRFNINICPKYRPIAHARSQMNALRNQASSHQGSSLVQPSLLVQASPVLPSLTIIHKLFVPTIKNIPV